MATKPQAPAAVTQVPAIRLQSFMELERFAQLAAKSSFVPKDYQNRPDNIMVSIQLGSEVGLAPMQSLQNVAVINGKPCIYGDAMLALILASPVCEDVIETPELNEAGQVIAYTCVAKRRGRQAKAQRFTVEDAKQARLWGKAGPWTEYPARMLQMRARSWALRDQFPDVLKGLIAAEEANDIPRGPTIEGEPQPPPTPKPPAPPPAPPQPPRPAAAPASVESAPTINGNGCSPASNGTMTEEQRAVVFSRWIAKRAAELDAAESLDEVNAINAAQEEQVRRLRASEHSIYSDLLATARDRYSELRIDGEERLRG